MATVTGNPQNLIVSVQGGIAYVPFVVALGPVALIGSCVVLATIALVHRREIAGGRLLAAPPDAAPLPRRPLALAVGWAVALLAAFLAGAPVATAALVVGTGMLLTAGAGWAHDVAGLAAITAIASNLFSNVPAVLLLAPLVAEADAGQVGFLVLAMGSTLAGNPTLVGSVANLIVAEGARKLGVAVGFWDYLRVGLPITLLTLALGAGWLAFAVA